LIIDIAMITPLITPLLTPLLMMLTLIDIDYYCIIDDIIAIIERHYC
jgi:hypothetical protein